jgi:quinol monooxygenase YgiN
MIIRIVKLTFKENGAEEFLRLFNERKKEIRHFPGCLHLEVWREEEKPDVIFTYSHWESEKALNGYRYSDYFKDTWSKAKPLFAEKAQAWSVTCEIIVE